MPGLRVVEVTGGSPTEDLTRFNGAVKSIPFSRSPVTGKYREYNQSHVLPARTAPALINCPQIITAADGSLWYRRPWTMQKNNTPLRRPSPLNLTLSTKHGKLSKGFSISTKLKTSYGFEMYLSRKRFNRKHGQSREYYYLYAKDPNGDLLQHYLPLSVASMYLDGRNTAPEKSRQTRRRRRRRGYSAQDKKRMASAGYNLNGLTLHRSRRNYFTLDTAVERFRYLSTSEQRRIGTPAALLQMEITAQHRCLGDSLAGLSSSYSEFFNQITGVSYELFQYKTKQNCQVH